MDLVEVSSIGGRIRMRVMDNGIVMVVFLQGEAGVMRLLSRRQRIGVSSFFL